MNPDHTVSDIAPLMASISKLSSKIVLFGAGAAGGYALKHLRERGIEPVAVVDNRPEKWGATIQGDTCREGISGIRIMDPEMAHERFPDAECVASAISRPAATEIRDQLRRMGVKTKPLWECLPVCHGLPPRKVQSTIAGTIEDEESLLEWCDQYEFREKPDYDLQRPPSDIKDIYFPGFIKRRDDEHYADCGAADGDTIKEFLKRWPQWGSITAFEPDRKNWEKLYAAFDNTPSIYGRLAAVTDVPGLRSFVESGDYSSHLGEGQWKTACVRLDDEGWHNPPTYIKMDIEGAELEALWGARRILKEHSPVLAICAYHTSDHLWQIPLLIHAIQPDYQLFFRRYAEGAFELVWYAVPPERVK